MLTYPKFLKGEVELNVDVLSDCTIGRCNGTRSTDDL